MKLPLHPPPWDGRAAVMATWEEGGFRRFALAGRSDIITAEAADGELRLYPDRSNGHRALLTALGVI